jgi:hypothetical protein
MGHGPETARFQRAWLDISPKALYLFNIFLYTINRHVGARSVQVPRIRASTLE